MFHFFCINTALYVAKKRFIINPKPNMQQNSHLVPVELVHLIMCLIFVCKPTIINASVIFQGRYDLQVVMGFKCIDGGDGISAVVQSTAIMHMWSVGQIVRENELWSMPRSLFIPAHNPHCAVWSQRTGQSYIFTLFYREGYWSLPYKA